MSDYSYLPMTPEDYRIWANLRHVLATYGRENGDGWLLRRRCVRADIRDETVMFKLVAARA